MSSTDYDVFLSHNSADKPAVEELARLLVEKNIRPWLDKWNLIPGDPWLYLQAVPTIVKLGVFMKMERR